MPATVLYMSMSLDGFITGPDDDHDNPLGIDGHRLHDWLSDGAEPGAHRPPGVATAMARAKEAASDSDVLVHGARTAQLALAAGGLDELEIHVIPVLLGDGRRLFDHLGTDHIELEPTQIIDAPGVTHLRYRVRR